MFGFAYLLSIKYERKKMLQHFSLKVGILPHPTLYIGYGTVYVLYGYSITR